MSRIYVSPGQAALEQRTTRHTRRHFRHSQIEDEGSIPKRSTSMKNPLKVDGTPPTDESLEVPPLTNGQKRRRQREGNKISKGSSPAEPVHEGINARENESINQNVSRTRKSARVQQDNKGNTPKKRRLENGRSVKASRRRDDDDESFEEVDEDEEDEDDFDDLDDEDEGIEIDVETIEDGEDVWRIEKIFACRWRARPDEGSVQANENGNAVANMDGSNISIPSSDSTSVITMMDNSSNVSNTDVSMCSSFLSSSITSSLPRTLTVESSMASIKNPQLPRFASQSTPVSTFPSPSNSSYVTISSDSAVPSESALVTSPAPFVETPDPFFVGVLEDTPLQHPPSLSSPTAGSIDQEMEYLVKFEGSSYRRLQWKTRSELVDQKNDSADIKIQNFHRRMSPSIFNKEIPLTAQDEGNFLLYKKIDRVIGVRPFESGELETPNKGMSQNKKEYLVKWELLNYGESTWELDTDLNTVEDREAISRFNEINTSFEFPVCAPAPGTMMALDASPLKYNHRMKRGSKVEGEEPLCITTTSAVPGLIEGEVYQSDAVTKQEGATRLWQAFLRRKLGADGVYIPSIRRKKEIKFNGDSSKDEDIVSSRSLMGHQQEGLKWMFFNSEVNRHGSLLADEMGLGKTCQSIAFLEHYLDIMSVGKGIGCHALVVVQKSVVENWRREFRAWAPHLNVVPLFGGRRDREIEKEYEYKWFCPETGDLVNPPPNLTAKKFMKPDVVLVTYEGLRTPEFQQLTNRNFKWTVVVVDECQKVKGGRSSLLLNLLVQLKREMTILLTGTPVQNTTEEIFPMLSLIHPTRFSYDETKDTKNSTYNWSVTRFSTSFSQIQDRDNCMQLTEELHQLISPYILRREKTHVLKTLPPKTVKLVKIPLTLTQKRVYSALYHKSIRTKGLKFSNIHMQLRKCCIHPYLIEGMESLILAGKIGDSKEDDDSTNKLEKNVDIIGTSTCKEESAEEKGKRLILESSGKFVLLKKMLESFREARRKVLIFTFFKTALDLIEDFIQLYKFPWTTERVDGETSLEDRQLSIDRFNSDPNRFLFLCTTRAGGLGINLTAASVVIHLDSDFNPQHDIQAQARCHRIGQDKNVDVFHFIAEHTYEDYMLFTIAGKKLGLEAVLLGRLDATKGKAKLDKRQEEKVLRKGVFAAIRDDEAAGREAEKFAESTVEEILSANSTTVTLEEDLTTDSGEASVDGDVELIDAKNELPSHRALFSTAKFAVSNSNNRDVIGLEGLDEDEPDFWVKVAQRLGPWVLEEEKPRELTRADRRKGRNINYRSAFYDDEYSIRDGSRRSRLPKMNRCNEGELENSDDGASSSNNTSRRSIDRRQDLEDLEDEVFTPFSGSSEGSDFDDDGDCIVQEDIEIGMQLDEKTRFPGISAKHKRSRGEKCRKQRFTWKKFTDSFQPIFQVPGTVSSNAVSGSISVSGSSGNIGPLTSSPDMPSGSQGGLLILDLLYRCLRALKRWKLTKVGDTGGLRTDDIRDSDRHSPWVMASSAGKQRTTVSGADQLLRQSWFETLQEWKQAGIEFESKKSSIVDHWAKQVLETRREELENLWMSQLQPNMWETIKSKEQLIQQMNQFFVAEARRQALLSHGQVIIRHLQNICDELAADVLTGKHFSREFTVKKQTWIGSEDFCTKLVFVHLMAQRYAAVNPANPLPGTIMNWPPPQMEVNWTIVTEVVKQLNKYMGGPERRRAAIHERFYNKLDSRWDHEDFDQAERDALAIAVANGLAAHIVAEEMPGRTLERVKKGLRCPSVIRESQRAELLIRSLNNEDGNQQGSPTIVDVVSRFREICQNLGLTEKLVIRQGTNLAEKSHSSAETSSIARAITVAPIQKPSAEIERPSSNLLPLDQMSRRQQNILPQPQGAAVQFTRADLLIESIRCVLLRIGVHESDFEGLRPSLVSQPLDRLTTLLNQLRDVQLREVRNTPSSSSSSVQTSPSVTSTSVYTPPPSHNVVPAAMRGINVNPTVPVSMRGALTSTVSTGGVSLGRNAPLGVCQSSVVVLDDDDDLEESQAPSGGMKSPDESGSFQEQQRSMVDLDQQKEIVMNNLRKPEAVQNASSMDSAILEKDQNALLRERLELQRKIELLTALSPQQLPQQEQRIRASGNTISLATPPQSFTAHSTTQTNCDFKSL